MKKIFILLVVTSSFVACKKATTTTPTNTTNSVTCVDNPNINFTSIGTPIGKFADCLKDIDGNSYKTVTIGTQTWMAENLKTTKYNDGTVIPKISDDSQWQNITTGAWVYYFNDEDNNAKYGKLYNWYALSKTSNGNKNLCPTGWHVPSDIEWENLITFLGGKEVAGDKMKEVGVSSWRLPRTESTNRSLFSGLAGGGRSAGGNFSNLIVNGYWWSSTEIDNTNAWTRFLDDDDGFADTNSFDKSYGLSIRCMKN